MERMSALDAGFFFLEDDNVPLECRDLIRAQLLSQTQAHIRGLDRILAAP